MFVNVYIHKIFLPWLRKKLGHKHSFERIEEEMEDDTSWPPYESCDAKQHEMVSSKNNFTMPNRGVRGSTLSELKEEELHAKRLDPQVKILSKPVSGRPLSALLETNFTALNTHHSVSSKSLPEIEKEVESLKEGKQWKRQSYTDEKYHYI